MDEFFVIFSKSDRWYLKYLKKGFGHCSVAKKISKEIFILIDPFTTYTGCYLVDREFMNKKMQVSKILYLKKELDKTEKRVSFGVTPRTCVSVVKGFLGLEDRRVITPYGLYQCLRKLGAINLN
jgi:hypothetical protein